MTARTIYDFHDALRIERRGEVVGREAYLDYMTFRRNMRPLLTEIFGPLVGLKNEWAAQGATPRELNFSAFTYRFAEEAHLPIQCGFCGGAEERILEETDEHIIATDRMRRTVKLCKAAATIPLPLDYPVRTRDDWRRIRHHYEFSEDRFGDNWPDAAREQSAAGRVITVAIPGGFAELRELMGDEALCVAFYDQPELIEEMLATIGETACKVLDRVSAEVRVDQLAVHEDMAGKTGPLIGPDIVRRFISPYYRRVWDLLSGRGARLFKQDSDGDMRPLIPAFLDAGVNLMYPFEPAAGMDPAAARERFGNRLAIMGGLDKHVLRSGRDAITAELEAKIPPLMRTGAVVFALDHRVPNGTPLDAYRFYIEEAWRIIDHEAARLGL